MKGLGGTVAAALAFAAGFSSLFLALAALSSVTRAPWLVPALALALTWLVSQLRADDGRFRDAWLLLFYGSAFGLCFLASLSDAPQSARVTDALAIVKFTLIACLVVALPGHVLSWLGRPSFGWLHLGLGMGLAVAFFSGSVGGTGGGAWERWLVDTLGVSADAAAVLVIAIRKTVHFLFYGFLGLAFFRAARSERMATRGAIWFGLLAAALFAAFDEGRQTVLPDRTGSVLDFGIDLAGAAVLIALSLRKKSD